MEEGDSEEDGDKLGGDMFGLGVGREREEMLTGKEAKGEGGKKGCWSNDGDRVVVVEKGSLGVGLGWGLEGKKVGGGYDSNGRWEWRIKGGVCMLRRGGTAR